MLPFQTAVSGTFSQGSDTSPDHNERGLRWLLLPGPEGRGQQLKPVSSFSEGWPLGFHISEILWLVRSQSFQLRNRGHPRVISNVHGGRALHVSCSCGPREARPSRAGVSSSTKSSNAIICTQIMPAASSSCSAGSHCTATNYFFAKICSCPCIQRCLLFASVLR